MKQEPDPREVLRLHCRHGDQYGSWKNGGSIWFGFASLLSTARNFLRLETLREANDAISNAIATLPAFHLFDIQDEIHPSSDGQRLEHKSIPSTLDIPQVFWIGQRGQRLHGGSQPCTAQYQSHRRTSMRVITSSICCTTTPLISGLTVTRPIRMEPTRSISGSCTHSVTSLLPVIGICVQENRSLVGFQHPSHYGDLLIKPARKVNGELIIQEWPNIQRIMASLAQKDVTQATIIRKLEQLCPPESNEEGIVGVRCPVSDPLHSRFCRRRDATTECTKH